MNIKKAFTSVELLVVIFMFSFAAVMALPHLSSSANEDLRQGVSWDDVAVKKGSKSPQFRANKGTVEISDLNPSLPQEYSSNEAICDPPCNKSETCCQTGDGTLCFNLNADVDNCGACGISCPNGQKCQNGECRCSSDSQCDSAEKCCDGKCIFGSCCETKDCTNGEFCCQTGDGMACIEAKDEQHCGSCEGCYSAEPHCVDTNSSGIYGDITYNCKECGKDSDCTLGKKCCHFKCTYDYCATDSDTNSDIETDTDISDACYPDCSAGKNCCQIEQNYTFSCFDNLNNQHCGRKCEDCTNNLKYPNATFSCVQTMDNDEKEKCCPKEDKTLPTKKSSIYGYWDGAGVKSSQYGPWYKGCLNKNPVSVRHGKTIDKMCALTYGTSSASTSLKPGTWVVAILTHYDPKTKKEYRTVWGDGPWKVEDRGPYDPNHLSQPRPGYVMDFTTPHNDPAYDGLKTDVLVFGADDNLSYGKNYYVAKAAYDCQKKILGKTESPK